MEQQRRCLSGMTGGAPIAVATSPAAATPLHTLPSTTASDPVGSALDVVTLFVHNAGAGAAFIAITFGAITLNVLVQAGEVVKVLDEVPLGGTQSGTGGTSIRGQGEALSTFKSWGWFFRSQG